MRKGRYKLSVGFAIELFHDAETARRAGSEWSARNGGDYFTVRDRATGRIVYEAQSPLPFLAATSAIYGFGAFLRGLLGEDMADAAFRE